MEFMDQFMQVTDFAKNADSTMKQWGNKSYSSTDTPAG